MPGLEAAGSRHPLFFAAGSAARGFGADAGFGSAGLVAVATAGFGAAAAAGFGATAAAGFGAAAAAGFGAVATAGGAAAAAGFGAAAAAGFGAAAAAGFGTSAAGFGWVSGDFGVPVGDCALTSVVVVSAGRAAAGFAAALACAEPGTAEAGGALARLVPSTTMGEPHRLQLIRTLRPRTFSSGMANRAGQLVQWISIAWSLSDSLFQSRRQRQTIVGVPGPLRAPGAALRYMVFSASAMTVWHLARCIAETARISAPTLVDAATGRLTAEVCDARLDSWSRRLLEQARIEITTSGLDRAPPGETFVIMSNHQSIYDIPVVYQALARRIRMVAKTELFRIPGWAGAMRASGFIEIDRQNRERAIEGLARAKVALESGTNIWIAPEGTRSDTGKLGPFKKGGFHLALDTGARILPITISGSRDVLAARTWTVKPGGTVHVTVHAPVDPKAYGKERRQELIEAVRAAIASALPAELRD